MFSYGLGDAGTGLVATQFGFFLFKFFISAGLPVIIAGSLLMLIKIWDAVNDQNPKNIKKQMTYSCDEGGNGTC